MALTCSWLVFYDFSARSCIVSSQLLNLLLASAYMIACKTESKTWSTMRSESYGNEMIVQRVFWETKLKIDLNFSLKTLRREFTYATSHALDLHELLIDRLASDKIDRFRHALSGGEAACTSWCGASS